MRWISCKRVIEGIDIYNLRYNLFLLFFLSNLIWISSVQAQEETAPGKYRIDLTDKNDSPFTLEKPNEFLSLRAIERRRKQEIPLDFKDLPVNPRYIDSIQSIGARILTISKWFNSVTIDNPDSLVLQRIMDLSFVKPASFQILRAPVDTKNMPAIASDEETRTIDYGYSDRQITLHNGDKLHNLGYTGDGIQIAVIDAGFYDVDKLEAFDHLWEENKILGTRDFVDRNSNIFKEHTHGKTILSILSAFIPGYLVGSAPDASYWLLRSEDVNSEYRIEEDNWIAAAEFADSAGADIINTSLGYSIFNDTAQNYTYADMDGNTTRISVAADIAVSRGMLVVVSAGNEGGKAWHYITAPADADSVLAVGAIDSLKTIAYFSGRGPSSDDRIKPDVCAMGVKTYVQGLNGTIAFTNGTSASAPIISGLAACLWQANPDSRVMDIHDAILKSADRYNNPDSLYGYGIPDFNLAGILLKMQKMPENLTDPVSVFPNPFHDKIYIWLNVTGDLDIVLTLYDISGRKLSSGPGELSGDHNYITLSKELQFLPRGMYLLNIVAKTWNQTTPLIKF